MQTPQELLGVSQEASVSEIRSAYRALARRWHPDRFAPGPERDWAGEKMAQINSAYRDLLRAARSREDADADKLTRVKALIADGRLSTARELLMAPARTHAGRVTRMPRLRGLFNQ